MGRPSALLNLIYLIVVNHEQRKGCGMKRRIAFTAGIIQLFLAIIITLTLQGTAFAFHDGGVASCEGCHTMHNSLELKGMITAGGPGNPSASHIYLLKGVDAGSTCLNCHATGGPAPDQHHIATYPAPLTGSPPTQYTPGGDFGWLKKEYTWVSSEGMTTGTSRGERHGHNIIAADFGFVQDSTQLVSPGGSYPAEKLSCVSCHDPHGRWRVTNGTTGAIAVSKVGTKVLPIIGSGSYGDLPTATGAVGVYRLLGGKGYYPRSAGVDNAFTQQAFIAVAPTNYNRTEEASDTRVAYGKDVSLWCANCHFEMHDGASGNPVHPVGAQLGPSGYDQNYNAYVKTGNLTGNSSTAFTSMVPFQSDSLVDLTILKNATISTAGPAYNDKVMCLTCHRAHATGWDSSTRWNMNSTFIVVAGAYPGVNAPGEGSNTDYAMGRTQAEIQATFYNRPASIYANYQKSLCDKCHVKD